MPRRYTKRDPVEVEEVISDSDAVEVSEFEYSDIATPVVEVKKETRGRKPKYATEEERKEAKKISLKKYLEAHPEKKKTSYYKDKYETMNNEINNCKIEISTLSLELAKVNTELHRVKKELHILKKLNKKE
jgi:hypothetical protein